jgi:hypothetical protein
MGSKGVLAEVGTLKDDAILAYSEIKASGLGAVVVRKAECLCHVKGGGGLVQIEGMNLALAVVCQNFGEDAPTVFVQGVGDGAFREAGREMRIYGMKRPGTKIAFDVAVSKGQLSTSVISAHSGIDGVSSNQSELFER